MKKIRISADVTGLDKLLKAVGNEGASQLLKDIDNIVEKNALKIVNEAKKGAPEDERHLRNSISLYGKKVILQRTVGSDRDYAQRQEYEHKTKKGYFRKAMWNGRAPFRAEIQKRIKDIGG